MDRYPSCSASSGGSSSAYAHPSTTGYGASATPDLSAPWQGAEGADRRHFGVGIPPGAGHADPRMLRPSGLVEPAPSVPQAFSPQSLPMTGGGPSFYGHQSPTSPRLPYVPQATGSFQAPPGSYATDPRRGPAPYQSMPAGFAPTEPAAFYPADNDSARRASSSNATGIPGMPNLWHPGSVQYGADPNLSPQRPPPPTSSPDTPSSQASSSRKGSTRQPVYRVEGEPLRYSAQGRPLTHVCEICSQAFDRPSALQIHERKHTGERPFPCIWPECPKRFTTHGNASKHSKICPLRIPEEM